MATRNSEQSGRIQVIFGPMFSGKTTELIRRIKRFQISNYTCVVVKYENDCRYINEEAISTHDKLILKAVSATNLSDKKDELEKYDVIGIDEGQFFPDISEFSEEMANKGKIVIVSALDGTYQRHSFGNVLKLVPFAENVTKLTAVCMTCFGDASFTKRISNETAIEVIGGPDKYMAVCRKCYFSDIIESPRKPQNQLKRRNNSNPMTNGKRALSDSDFDNHQQ